MFNKDRSAVTDPEKGSSQSLSGQLKGAENCLEAIAKRRLKDGRQFWKRRKEPVNTISVREGLAEKFKNKEYRDAFVAEQIFSRLPLKIRSIREEQELTQRQLGELADMAQTWVSKLEDPNYGKLTISTLLKLAAAFDVGLHVDFVPFSKVLDGAMRLRSVSFAVPKFADDQGFAYTLSEREPEQACAAGGDNGETTDMGGYTAEVVEIRQGRPPQTEICAMSDRSVAAGGM